MKPNGRPPCPLYGRRLAKADDDAAAQDDADSDGDDADAAAADGDDVLTL